MAGLAAKALLSGVIDYAGCFPPASLSLECAQANYMEYRNGPYGWTLGWFVVRARDVSAASTELNGCLSVIGADDPRASAVEIAAVKHFPKPTYCEVSEVTSVQQIGSFAKIRTGGVTADAVPDAGTICAFMQECARLRLPFKATAGLHHAVRGNRKLTYDEDSPVAFMYGFLNLLFAACWLWNGGEAREALRMLNETDAAAFRCADDRIAWRDCVLNAEQIQAARRDFIHSFGSCSFTEPVGDLQELGWL